MSTRLHSTPRGHRRSRLIAAAVIALLPAVIPAQDNAALTRRFYERNTARDSAALHALIGSDIHFEDPTFGLRMAGRTEVVKLYADNFRLVDAHQWDVHELFSTDSFVVVRGSYTSRLDGARVGVPGVKAGATVPFFSVLTWRHGVIVDLKDFFAYDVWDAANPGLRIPAQRRHVSLTVLTRVADQFVSAGARIPQAIDEFTGLFADTMSFVDPTFRLGLTGRDRFRSEVLRYAEIGRPFNPRSAITNRFLSGAFIALWGVYSQDNPKQHGQRASMRFLTVLELDGEQIVRQRDFYEAAPFNAAISGRQ